MAKIGCSEFFLTIFPKKTGINSEWPKMAVLNFSDNLSQKDWYSKSISTFLVQKDWKNCQQKFGMAIFGHSKFFLAIFLYILL